MAVSSHGGPRPLAGRRRVPWSPLFLGALLVAVVYIQVAVTGNREIETPMFGVCFMVLALAGLAFSIRAAFSRRLDRPARRPWRFMAAALFLHIVSTAAFAVGGEAGLPALEWVGISLRLAMVPMLLMAVLSFPMRRLTDSERLKLGLDVTTVAGGGFIVMWYFIIGPALTSGQPANIAVSLAGFPLGDLVLVFGVCAVLLRGGAATPKHPLTTLLVGLVIFLAGDVYYSYAELQERGHSLSLGVRLWLLAGSFLIAVAAAQQLRRPADAPAVKPHRAGAGGVSQLPYAGLATGYLLLLFATAREGDFFPWGGLVVGVIMMTGAVAVRQLIAMRENHKLVVTDSLTGLANRVRLRARLEQILNRQQPVAVLLIDLDGFKQVNDTLGHEAGDSMLVGFAQVLQHSVRPTDTASRLGGDEFAVVLPDVTDLDQAGVVAARILATAATPVPVADTMLPIRGSIGIALARPGEDIQALLHRADVAMYAAKRAGSHGWLAYTESMEDKLGQDAQLAEDLGGALNAGQLRLFYQPITALSGGDIAAVEAMVRWEHPTHGLLTPDVLLPIAERTGAIREIGLWAIEETCRQVHQWQQDLPGQPLHASVTLSPYQLQQPDLVTDVLAAVHRTGLALCDLVLVLTDGALLNDERVVGHLRALREHGIRVALDDFGTGYASVRDLRRLPVDVLKLDRCFVAELDAGHEGSAVAEAVIRLSRVLRVDTAADGRRKPVTVAQLRPLGVPASKEHLFANPMPAPALQELLRAPAATSA
ncbi:MAG TPA: EAL domain-containing protein [Pilimelia sp.]|nr:EAL domain-containing protein [Pilimelia sp.]